MALLNRLPGGKGVRVMSLDHPEYQSVNLDRGTKECSDLSKPYNLMRARIHMVPMQCGDAFGSVRQAATELQRAAAMAGMEVQQALSSWASIAHDGVLYTFEGVFDAVGDELQSTDRGRRQA